MEKESPIYVLGHKNPDADAICSALAYAAYKHALGETHYLAARCGNTNPRIDAIIEHFQLPVPVFLSDVTPRIDAITSHTLHTVTPQSTCAEALELIDKYDVRALPVTDSNNQLLGAISFFQLGEFFVPKPRTSKDMRRVKTDLDSIVRSLNAKTLNIVDSQNIQELYVRVGAMHIKSFDSYRKENNMLAEQSIIIVGDRRDIQKLCIEKQVRLLIITGGLEVDSEIIKSAKENEVSLIISPYDSASTSWIVRTATHIDSLYEKKVKCFSAEDSIQSVKSRIAASNDPLYMVTNDRNELQGVFSKSDILRPSKTRIALVDHNELNQAVNGADKVQIVEILDHHKLGNLPTQQPILFINRPVGSTCSIVADLFRQSGLTPSRAIAGALMSGIISDTLNLHSPTSTLLEGELLEWLAPIADIESNALAELIFSSGSVITNETPDAVIRSDCKEYTENDLRYSVSQIEELGFDNFNAHSDSLSTALKAHRKSEGLRLSFLLITDVNSQDSLLIASGESQVLDCINYPKRGDSNVYFLSGIVSRKKQLIPYIGSLLKSSGLLDS
ncbi:MAG: Cobalt-dependent inorganic pyrophosphatase [Opitutia bacterium UBA7350]|nr:MAG: Cobalt-dependent inorganic pyrophosphatase [Opitutae bacterium UBA7350]